MARDSSHWMDESDLRQLGIHEDEQHLIRHTPFGREIRWNFWDVHDWLDERVKRRNGIAR